MFSNNSDTLDSRRELTYLILSGIFIGSMAMLNILGTSKILDLGFSIGKYSMTVPVGVLAYPITFLCTDLISEIFGKRRANQLVWVGFIVNVWVLMVLQAGSFVPAWKGTVDSGTFDSIKIIATDTVVGSMLAYLAAQFIDVYIFHYFKDLTKNKHLWLRNNASTMTSQLVDTLIVILYVHFANDGFNVSSLSGEEQFEIISTILISTYLFKFIFALLDTIPFIFLTIWLRKWLNLYDE